MEIISPTLRGVTEEEDREKEKKQLSKSVKNQISANKEHWLNSWAQRLLSKESFQDELFFVTPQIEFHVRSAHARTKRLYIPGAAPRGEGLGCC
jgi:isocitrate dehydrogenase kinase/phosphatase